MSTIPALITFDVFGTIVDWRRGLLADLARAGCSSSDELFDKIIGAQAASESGPFRTYREITATSLMDVAGLNSKAADQIGKHVGEWPLHPDARVGLERIGRLVPRIAMTNSDRIHGTQVQAQLGFQLDDWICAEDVHVYKPDAQFWHAVAAKRKIKPGASWWHASAYADYDLATARRLGLTTVFVAREHSLAGHAHHRVNDLCELAQLIESLAN